MPEPSDAVKCRRCPAAIIWAVAKSTGKPMPVDAEPTDDGNVLLTPSVSVGPDGRRYGFVADVLSAKNPDRAAHAGRLRKNHFVTCPAAASFRKKAAP